MADQIELGVPLPFGLRDQQRTLLLATGRVVATELQRKRLVERGL